MQVRSTLRGDPVGEHGGIVTDQGKKLLREYERVC
jgi:hypothetical protein